MKMDADCDYAIGIFIEAAVLRPKQYSTRAQPIEVFPRIL